ncbi:acyl carrier protein [Rhizorhapis suberifaciens]|uniref:Acyl carrier protein n=1 Tax=Rhizorhapis suberifaciens TaxID=13656 RepID=A0A840HSV6_9SPHN|nr:acyl carrier protein [Rhizorhapis suberifaciens]MBB4641013.1 acyl carrier protein [Rhizorhapis suberifaciens]
MTEAEIYDALTQIMRDIFDDEELVIGPETRAEDVAGWDSQSHISLIVAAEQRFGIRFLTSEFESLHNVGEFIFLIEAKLSPTCSSL